MGSIGFPEMIVIGLVCVVLFGTKKLPDVGKGLGEGLKNLKAAMNGTQKEVEDVKHEVEKP